MARIQLKRAAKSVLDQLNIIPAVGEPIFEIDTGRMKIGDGVTTVANLAYSDATEIIDDTTAITEQNKASYAGKAASAKALYELEQEVANIDVENIDGGVLTLPDPEQGGGE